MTPNPATVGPRTLAARGRTPNYDHILDLKSYYQNLNMAHPKCLGQTPWISRLSILISIATLLVITNLVFVSACPRMNCAPIISKCQLIDACRCEASLNYTCFKACSHCLGEYYSECCSCVGVCPKEDENDKSLESHVKVFESTNDELFDLFASDDDLSARWIIHHDKITTQNSTASMNCTMAFLVSCVDMYKCESSCISMGASGYRWFHVGCCECVGKYCLNFGVNEIRCRNCPQDSEQVIDSSGDNL